MQSNLSIRSYSTKPTIHAHDFYQLVLPLRGVISIEVGLFDGKVAPGECVIVKKQEEHLFTANPEARFVVADMVNVPENISTYQDIVFAVKKPLALYLNFIEAQLELQVNAVLEKAMYDTFYHLLSEHILLPKLDKRIANVIDYIERNLKEKLTIATLASAANLSNTQFKVLFKLQTGLTAMDYVNKARIEKAQALLSHTDYPLKIIGEMVGYTDLSSFSRRFTQLVGLPPSKFKQ